MTDNGNEARHSSCENWEHVAIRKFLDAEYEISTDELKMRGWLAMPIPDFPNAMEAEWLADALLECGITRVTGIAFEFQQTPEVSDVGAGRDQLLRFFAQNSWRYAILVNRAESFVVYKDHANRFFLLCGTRQFVNKGYRCSVETAKLMYFEWANDAGNAASEREFLERIWRKYQG